MTSEAGLVDILGMFAGGIWISAAVYFQLIRAGRVEPGYVASLLLIGVALILGSSALTLGARPTTVELLGILANALMIVVGIGVWYFLEQSVCLQERKALPEDCENPN